MPEIHELNTTDANNTTRFPENQAPSTINNGGRALEGIIARFVSDLQGPNFPVATLSGSVIQFTANRTSITLTGTTSNYIANGLFGFIMGSNASLDGASVRINDIQTLSLRDNRGRSLFANTIPSGSFNLIIKDDTNNYFRVLTPVEPVSGTWTPIFLGDGTAGTGTYSAQSGVWTRNKDQITAHFIITASSLGTAAGNLLVGGLPFTSSAAYRGSLIISEYYGFNLPTGYSSLSGTTLLNTTNARLMRNGSSTNDSAQIVIPTDIAGTITLIGTVVYYAA